MRRSALHGPASFVNSAMHHVPGTSADCQTIGCWSTHAQDFLDGWTYLSFVCLGYASPKTTQGGVGVQHILFCEPACGECSWSVGARGVCERPVAIHEQI